VVAGDSQVFITAAGNLQLDLEAQGSGRAAGHGADARTEMRLVGKEVFLEGLDAIMATRRAAVADSTAFHDLDCEDRVNIQTTEFRVLLANISPKGRGRLSGLRAWVPTDAACPRPLGQLLWRARRWQRRASAR
jgi:hypothetical protein